MSLPGGTPRWRRSAPWLAAFAIFALGVTAAVAVFLATRPGGTGPTRGWQADLTAEVPDSEPAATATPPAVLPRPIVHPSPSGAGGPRWHVEVVPDSPPDDRAQAAASASDHDDRLEALTTARERRLTRSIEMLNRRAARARP